METAASGDPCCSVSEDIFSPALVLDLGSL